MTINYTQEFEKLIILDLQTDKKNYYLVHELLSLVEKEQQRIKNFIIEKGDRITILQELLEQMAFVEEHRIELNEYTDTRVLQLLINSMQDCEVTHTDILTNKKNIMVFYDKFSPCRFIESDLLRTIKKEGFLEIAKTMRFLQYHARKPPIKYLLQLFDLYLELDVLVEDLEREKRKIEAKLSKGGQKQLLDDLRLSRINYSKDTQLLITGLLETEGNFYHTLKSQLDEQYNKVIQEKLVHLNKLVNVQERILLDDQKIRSILLEIKRKSSKIMKYFI